ncbi:MAG: Cof-type HAD-IIB family hydrolase [Eubacteriaceae bacterium]
MKYKVLALDMDGTTLSSDVKLSSENLQAIKDAIAAGVTVLPATGRTQSLLPREITEIPGIQYAITSNGARVADVKTNETIVEIPINREDKEIAHQIFTDYDTFAEMYTGGRSVVAADKYAHLEDYIPEAYWEFFHHNVHPVSEEEYMDIVENGHVEKFNFFIRNDKDREAIFKRLREETGMEVIESAEGNGESMNKECSKGAALKGVCKVLGNGLESCIAVGDSNNDIQMLTMAGLGVAVGNALPHVKEIADVVTVTNNENAVAKVIHDYILDVPESEEEEAV